MAAVVAPTPAPGAKPEEDKLTKLWETPKNLKGFFGTVDHKEIGIRYLFTAFALFLAGGIEALLMRTQLAKPDNTFLSPDTFNQLFSMHGTTMIFLMATPLLFGFGNYVLPLMLGSRDMAFPRLNAFGYWMFLVASLFMYSSFAVGQAPAGGWFAYTPLTETEYLPNMGIDFWVLGVMLQTISTTAGAINFIVTIFKLRAPGMAIHRMPLFAWNILVTSFAVIFGYPPLTAANILLEADRLFGTRFFDVAHGGNPLLWQHLFWLFGHPDVYIIFLPAVGIVSSVLPAFSRRSMVGYSWVVLATVTTGIVAFGVWVHHMFATGLPTLSLSFFGAASTIIAIPAGVQYVCWIATIWRGKPWFSTAFMFVLGFLSLFVLGGVTGVMFAMVPFDQQTTDTYFVVAHFHYVLFGGAVFPIFAGFYYWMPKMMGRLMSEKLGHLSFWLIFVGFNVTFFPMHIVGLLGMPRRVYTYQPGLGWDTLNLVETIGSYILASGVLVTMVNWFWSKSHGVEAGKDPWQADTLEWAADSPPEPFNFRFIPAVHSRNPLWDQEVLDGVYNDEHQTLDTSVLDADTQHLLTMPHDSLWPLALAICLGLLFSALLLHQLWLGWIAAAASILSLNGWLWPSEEFFKE
ncbi:MAG: cytochrome c oxidase subunit I [Chloroflexi bacterium]|nr:cytochrome c oxidase subunit I [Chloroflexota bacterium]